jgi:hypothetical protein
VKIPGVAPVTIPVVEPIVATVVGLTVQVTPGVLVEQIAALLPTHMAVGPHDNIGNGFTVITIVREQPAVEV